MRHFFLSGLTFVKENPRLLYSIVLLVFVPGAIFFNTYSIIQRVEQDINLITQRKAVLAEQLVNQLVSGHWSDVTTLQTIVETLIREHTEILSLAFLSPDQTDGTFRVIASSEPESIGQMTDNIQYVLAWNKPEGIAYLDQLAGERFWRVTRQLAGDNTDKVGLVTMAFSLKDSDALVESLINRSYGILFVTIVVVLLLVSNQARLFGSVLAFNRLKEVDAMKDNLVSMASHELRSPLTAIRGYLDLLRDKPLTLDAEAKKYFTNIEHSIDRLNTLVKDMLEVSKLEGNRIPLTIVDFEAEPVITQCVEELRSQAIGKGLALTLDTIEPAELHADSDRVREILINLIGNAIKYTAKGSVTVSGRAQGKEYLVTVADTGFGISAEDQKRLFQKFSRIQNEHTKTITGTGLGLWITHELATRMGGTITVESISGVGSHFTLHIPLATAK